MKTILQTLLKPHMTRMNVEARGCATKEPRANHRQVLDCGSPLPLSNRNEFVQRAAKRQRAGALQDASRPLFTTIFHSPSSILAILGLTLLFAGNVLRKLRLQCSRAMYYGMYRGDHREAIFRDDSALFA